MKDTIERQMSESIISWILLSFSGGAMDAHSYLFRGSVFSNAQTGNILLFGVNLATGDFPQALKHLWPILAFMVGIFLADRIRYSWHLSNRHWRQDAVGLELGLIFLVALMPNSVDAVANALLSLACGIQMESFRSVRSNLLYIIEKRPDGIHPAFAVINMNFFTTWFSHRRRAGLSR